MTVFLRLLTDAHKSRSLGDICNHFRNGQQSAQSYEVEPDAFRSVPGAPFAYWVSEEVRRVFQKFAPFESNGRVVRQGLATADDFRFVRAWWEIDADHNHWPGFAKGGVFSPFYHDIFLAVNWRNEGAEIRNFFNLETGKLNSRPQNIEYFRRSGLTWPLRAKRFSPQALPKECVFSVRGYSAFPEPNTKLSTLALFNSSPFDYLFKTALGRFGYPEFIVGILQIMPWPEMAQDTSKRLAERGLRSWSLKRQLDTVSEISHAFLLPAALRARLGDEDLLSIEADLAKIQAEIDEIAFGLYGFSEEDRAAALGSSTMINEDGDGGAEDLEDSEDDDSSEAIDRTDSLLSWAVGVAFGRFDWRLAIGEREVPPEPEPFDPLPAKSPGMLPDGASPFHAHHGILVDDQGHPHDLPQLIEEVLVRVDVEVPSDMRRWLQRDFFPMHLKQYSKSRRKAPIYWPFSTASGSYTLWFYYPNLTTQTLYTAVNDFIEGPNGKLSQVRRDIASLRDSAIARSRDDDRALEALQTLELELIELRDLLLQIAATYRPNNGDGVQITAAPLWELFRYKPWQKVLKDTWIKLKKGDYDWAHLARAYWPERVREKCKTDRSLAIAHDLEHLYVEPEPKARSGKNADA